MVAASNGWIYYYTFGSPARIYRCKEDGSSKTLINEGAISSLNVIGDWIYFTNGIDSNKLYKMKTDGTSKQKMTDDNASYISVVGDWIYSADADRQ
jgi:hypothetical protein